MLNLSLKKKSQCAETHSGSTVAKQLHASKSVEFKQKKGSNFPGDRFQCCACLGGSLDIAAAHLAHDVRACSAYSTGGLSQWRSVRGCGFEPSSAGNSF